MVSLTKHDVDGMLIIGQCDLIGGLDCERTKL